MSDFIFKIVSSDQWAESLVKGTLSLSPLDASDGLIHFSAANQVAATLSRYFAGQPELKLLVVDVVEVLQHLKWEPSSNGELFPHLYHDLDLSSVSEIHDLPLDANGTHILPNHCI